MQPETQLWSPQPGPQLDAILATWCQELFYGGAAGGGKSDFLLGDFLQDVPTYGKAWKGIIFRRTYGELEELVTRAKDFYPASGGVWFDQKHMFVWPNGASLKFRYLESDKDVLRYHGHSYTWIGFDELTLWSSLYVYRYMRSRLRSASPVPTKRMRAASNPGGPGHHAVKAYFVTPAPLGYMPMSDENGNERMFIPSKLSDNKLLLQNDPTYGNRLRGLGSPDLVKALLDGNWNFVAGGYFPEFNTERHVIRPFEIPERWLKFAAMDWGSARPFSVGWYAVSDGNVAGIPRGALVKYREWYGCTDEPNTGLKLTAEQVGTGIKTRTHEKLQYAKADPAVFKIDGGPSIGERLKKSSGLPWVGADNKRLSGWDMIRARLIGEDDKPMIFFFSTCTHTIRTLPTLQHDALRPEDLDSDGEDHAADETRYACMSRPWVPAGQPQKGKTDRWDRAFKTEEGETSWKTA